MKIYSIANKKYNVNFDLKSDSFFDFIESLKESKKYYHDYCNIENINNKDFDNEYIDNINKLEGDLLKYYILITDDNDVEKYVIIDDTIREMYNCLIELFTNTTNGYGRWESNIIIIQGCFNINHLTREKVSILIKIYAYFCRTFYYNSKVKEELLQKINICTSISKLGIRIEEMIYINPNGIENLNNYLDSLSYETIYERELNKILNNLPNICLSNISSKKILNCDNDKEFIEVD